MASVVAATCPEVPNIVIYIVYLISLIQRFISWVFKTLKIYSLFMDTSSSDVSLPRDPIKEVESANLIRKMLLPVLKFEEYLVSNNTCTQESCAICLYEFESNDDIRVLMDCSHIFHESCLDGSLDHDHRTCPLCRTPLIPIETYQGS